MNFSLEIGIKTELNTLPKIEDVYITLLPGDQYKDVVNKAKELKIQIIKEKDWYKILNI